MCVCVCFSRCGCVYVGSPPPRQRARRRLWASWMSAGDGSSSPSSTTTQSDDWHPNRTISRFLQRNFLLLQTATNPWFSNLLSSGGFSTSRFVRRRWWRVTLQNVLVLKIKTQHNSGFLFLYFSFSKKLPFAACGFYQFPICFLLFTQASVLSKHLLTDKKRLLTARFWLDYK